MHFFVPIPVFEQTLLFKDIAPEVDVEFYSTEKENPVTKRITLLDRYKGIFDGAERSFSLKDEGNTRYSGWIPV